MTRTMTRTWLERILPALSVIGFLVAWQIFVDVRHIPSIYLPSPLAVAKALVVMAKDGSLVANLSMTLLRIFSGFLIAALSGIVVGLLMGMSRLFERVVDPWIAALYPLPKISLIPLLVIWLGTGESYKIIISAITAFFPIAMSTYAGVRQVDSGLIKAAKDLGASWSQVQLHVVLPASIPSIFSGLQLGMGVAIILVVAAEMIGSSGEGGMGYLLINAGQVLDTERVFASLVVLTIMGACIIKGQQWLERKLAPWATL
ncbi:ABC transporter permease [Hyphomicrobium sp. MC1]|uniref:ABC transporter permease n=1 Tax=Hyphomicrobium sp. (strain MC1) TaxID=717785 RepID=UPI000213F89D|nr:ABC transporter permease [Hyphomicrobium sp. MC1]CCB63500.1 putative aliphatic sulfonates transport permease protein ssuC [Hyphomicrobium sp. MC1]